eukprot:TRINITY_DN13463_c0_g1_i1.p1 TRINITY_DN13463_c0_g1~~TRINITY_DN13463_c0_g1_i1.p1  ORF type:complete len:574 (-),score=139.59 TRINITY_DN13463_c0_g1_i1:286-2007(-)
MPRILRASPPGTLPETLRDPCSDRSVTSTPAPPATTLGKDVCYGKKGKPDLDLLRRHLAAEGALSQELLFDLIEKAADLFDREPNQLKLEDPITVVGDIHGQFWDLMKLFEVGGPPGDTHYLFLGDYVDRGSFSIEVTAYLFACKIRYPRKVYMLRGNHECRQMTSFFNFREECEYKYDLGIYNAFMEAFDTLPLCATINGKYFAVHGGVSPDLTKLNELSNIDRMQEPPRDGVMCDLIWADPNDKEEEDDGGRKGKSNIKPFVHNDTRGCSYYFSSDAAAKFLKKNALLSIIRAHEAQAEGYKMHKANPATGFPSVITVFSAPNYCDTYNNKAAILKFDNSTLNVLQFNSSPHPYHLPNFMDIFAWSMPFVIEKVMEFAAEVLAHHGGSSDGLDCSDIPELPPKVLEQIKEATGGSNNESLILVQRLQEHLESKGEPSEPAPTAAPKKKHVSTVDTNALMDKVGRMRKKVKAIARMSRMFKTLREENQLIVQLKGVCPGNKIPVGVLLEGKDRIRSEAEMFGFLKDIDAENEVRPEVQPVMEMTRSLSLHKRKAMDSNPALAQRLADEDSDE